MIKIIILQTVFFFLVWFPGTGSERQGERTKNVEEKRKKGEMKKHS